MLYSEQDYSIHYYRNSRTLRVPVREYILKLPEKHRAKVLAYIRFLADQGGRLDEPYSRYIGHGVRELRVEFFKNRHRIIYLGVEGKKILLLHAFLKRTPKTPPQEVARALKNLADYQVNKNIVPYEPHT